MTVLTRYQRLESLGLWRAGPEAQRREVVVSIGEATLLLTEPSGRVVTQWSLPALERANPGARPALFGIEGYPDETLELSDTDMIDALEAVMAALSRDRARPGRLRFGVVAVVVAALLAACVFWLPPAISSYVARVAPQPIRAEIGQTVFTEIQALTGPACDAPAGRRALGQLGRRLFGDTGPKLSVLPSVLTDARHLPGARIVLGRGLVEDFETPEVVAAYLVAENLRRTAADPVERLLRDLGLGATVRLLTTGRVDRDAVSDWAARRLTSAEDTLSDATLLDALAAHGIPAAPYAYARDITGETSRELAAAAPPPPAAPLLEDGDWLALQRICEDRG